MGPVQTWSMVTMNRQALVVNRHLFSRHTRIAAKLTVRINLFFLRNVSITANTVAKGCVSLLVRWSHSVRATMRFSCRLQAFERALVYVTPGENSPQSTCMPRIRPSEIVCVMPCSRSQLGKKWFDEALGAAETDEPRRNFTLPPCACVAALTSPVGRSGRNQWLLLSALCGKLIKQQRAGN